MTRQISRLEQAKEDHSIALFFLNLRDVYFAFYLYLNFVLPPINDQGEERKQDEIIGLVIILAMVALSISFELVKYKKSLSPQLESNLERIWRHGINGIKDIAIILAFMPLLAQLLTPAQGEPEGLPADIINTANWLEQRNLLVKLGLSVPFIAAKALASFFLNRKEYLLIKPANEDSALLANPKELNDRLFTRYTLIRLLAQMLLMYPKGVIFAAVDLSLIEDFGVNISDETTKNYLLIKPLVQVVLYAILFDHPVYPAENLKKTGRFLHRFLTQAVENAEISFAIILNFLSFKSGQINLSDPTGLTLLTLCYLLATILSESHFRLTAVINDKAQLSKIMLTPKHVMHLAQGILIAGAVFPNTLIAWPGILAFSVFSFMIKLLKTPEKHTLPDRVISAPHFLTQQLAWASAALVLLETGTGSLELLYKSLMVVPAVIVFAIMSYFEGRKKPLEIINNSVKIGLLSSLAVTTIETSPMLDANRNYGLPLAAFLAPSIVTAAWQFWHYRKQQQALLIQDDKPDEKTKSQITFKPLAKGLFTLFSLLLAYNMTEKNNNSGDSLSGELTTYFIMLGLAATVTYLNFQNHGWKGFSNPLSRFGICQPRERYDGPVEVREGRSFGMVPE